MPNRRNVFFYHKPDEEMKMKASPLYDLVKRYDFNLEKDYRKANIIVSIGGDDTFLQAVRHTGFRDDCLYAGVSTSPKLTMYCDFHLDDPSRIIEATVNDNIAVRRYPTIEAAVDGEASFYCLNEFSLRSSLIQPIVMDVFIDDIHLETFRGNGMVVSTPTGSTAFSHSVGGAIVDPLLPCMQVSEVASVNNNLFRTLGSSFILAGDRTLSFKMGQDGNDYPIMGMDNEALSIQHVEKGNDT